MRNYPDIGVQVGEVLLPQKSIDLQKWAVIACDQFTSQPTYWQTVQDIVGSAPSTLNLTLPEVYLGTSQEKERVFTSQATMRRYLENQVLIPYEGLVYVERSVDEKTRRGLVLSLDLERYDYSPGSQSLIRATEGTILERLPPRIRIREGAPLELPHILVLIDDPEGTVIEPLTKQKDQMQALYDTDLMQGSGHLQGYLLDNLQQEEQVITALRKLADPQHFSKKYPVDPDKGVLLFAVGDGNHSLATAKAIWEKIKSEVGPDHPARYALVEVENVHDKGLIFEPIHRVLFGVKGNAYEALHKRFGGRLQEEAAADPEAMSKAVEKTSEGVQRFGMVSSSGLSVVTISQPEANLAAGTLQAFLDAWGSEGGFEHIDYVHGKDVVLNLGVQPDHLGFFLPGMDKSELFKTVILEGSLPRKTFSLGEAHEKRFYMECRRITV